MGRSDSRRSWLAGGALIGGLAAGFTVFSYATSRTRPLHSVVEVTAHHAATAVSTQQPIVTRFASHGTHMKPGDDDAEPSMPLETLHFGKPEEAIPAEASPSPEACAERDAELEKLRASGPGGGDWRAHFDDVRGEWLQTAGREHIATALGPWECFAGGCAVTARFEAVRDLDTFSGFAVSGISSKRWRGAGFRSGPIEASDGKIEATWIFYAPSRAGVRAASVAFP